MKKILLFVFTIACLSTFGQNKLDKSKKELSGGSSSSKNNSSTTTSNSSSNSSSSYKSNSGGGSDIFFNLFFNITFGVVKYGMIGDYKNENHLYSNLTPYPYYNGKSGNFENSDTVSVTKNKARIDVENSFVYENSNLYGNHLKAKIRPFQYLYLQSDFHQLFEFDKIDNTNNRLSLFQFNIGYDRIRFEKFNFGWTLGATYVGNEVKKAGFAYGLNAEYFMGNRISFMTSGKWSRINGFPVNAFELQSKFHRKNYYFSLGFEHLKIASPNYNFIALGGGIYF
ncbi:hypothetical protein OX283_001880 [Flavobacterium sp. SUN052]|uniref:hypothetical protein n=1 Tax=Flavobacterium sp. SUN052 TaxID=3002441 RepID=UPI00237E3C24|nr:hypothetical protein [Flavobacterium sp. SUN052]MEC4003392.1 hypothetical protein [Flavobacterium sp. SUN052]